MCWMQSTGVIFAHNHPSSIAEPSSADNQITRKIKEAMGIVEIRTMDYFIVGCEEAYLFAEHGIL